VALGWGLWEAPARFYLKQFCGSVSPLTNCSSAKITDEQTLRLQNEKIGPTVVG